MIRKWSTGLSEKTRYRISLILLSLFLSLITLINTQDNLMWSLIQWFVLFIVFVGMYSLFTLPDKNSRGYRTLADYKIQRKKSKFDLLNNINLKPWVQAITFILVIWTVAALGKLFFGFGKHNSIIYLSILTLIIFITVYIFESMHEVELVDNPYPNQLPKGFKKRKYDDDDD